MTEATIKAKSGRPPKFRGPRRPITVTLPESTLARLASIDPDRARAIVKATDTVMPFDAEPHKQVELVEVAPGLGIIIVGPSRLLQKIKWLRLVEVAPMRFLLTIPSGTSVDSIEVAVTDLLDAVKSYDDWEHSILSQLKDLIQRLRRRGQLSKAEMLFIDTRQELHEKTVSRTREGFGEKKDREEKKRRQAARPQLQPEPARPKSKASGRSLKS